MLQKTIKSIFGSLIGAILFFSVISSLTSFYFRQDWQKHTPILLILGLFLIFIIYTIINKLSKTVTWSVDKIILVLSIFLVPLQLFLIYSYYVEVNWWDVKEVVADAIYIADGNPQLLHNDYFSVYPNNLFLVNIFSKFLMITRTFGLNDDYFSLVIVQSILYSITGYLLYTVSSKLFNKKYGILAYILYLFLNWLSPYVSNPYSDSVGLIFPILILFLFIKFKENYKWYYGVLLAATSAIAYKIKPQPAILFIAIILIFLFFDKLALKQKLYYIGTSAVVFVVMLFVIQVSNQNLGYNLEKSRELPPIHWLVMGHNLKTAGTFYAPDVYFSMGIKNPTERKEKLTEEFINRVTSMNFIDLINLYRQKLQYSFTEGTFGSFIYGTNLMDDYNTYLSTPHKNILSHYTRRIFPVGAKYFPVLGHFLQSIWIPIIALSFLGVFIKKVTIYHYVIMVAIIGLFIFTTLFESGARYIFTYVPIFILAALYGLSTAQNIYHNNVSPKGRHYKKRHK